MAPLRLDESNFQDLPERDQHLALFRAVEKLTTKVEDLCGARRSFRYLAMKWGAIAGGAVSVTLITIHDPSSLLGRLASAVIGSWLGVK